MVDKPDSRLHSELVYDSEQLTVSVLPATHGAIIIIINLLLID